MPEAWAQSKKKGPGKYGVEYPCLEVPVHSFVPKVVTHLQPCHISTVVNLLPWVSDYSSTSFQQKSRSGALFYVFLSFLVQQIRRAYTRIKNKNT